MSALSRRSFLQSSAVVAGAAAVVGPTARAMASDSPSSSSSTPPSSTAPASGDDAPSTSPGDDPIIAYVNGSTVTVLSGEREITRTDADLARRITRAAKRDG